LRPTIEHPQAQLATVANADFFDPLIPPRRVVD